MGAALPIEGELGAAELRRWARRAPSPRAAARALAIANALDGMTRAEAARLAGMERQALRDARWSATTPRAFRGWRTGRSRGARRG
jgi:hypothetical protein